MCTSTSRPSMMSANEFKRRMDFNQEKIDNFIRVFNATCESKEGLGPILVNMNDFPKLTVAEFNFLKQKADSIGWIMTLHKGTHDSVTYRFQAKV